MYLTSEHQIGGKSLNGAREDFSYIVRYNWESPKHMKEAIKIMLSARLDGQEHSTCDRFESGTTIEQKEVQLRLASNPETGDEVLDYLRKVGDKRVLVRVAGNSNCSESTIQALSLHSESEVRAELTENPYCPITLLYRLTRDESPDVRLRLAGNSNLPLSILEELSNDENPYVAMHAKSTLKRVNGGTVIEANFAKNASSSPRLRVANYPPVSLSF